MPEQELGVLLAAKRRELGLSLREVEEKTGINNAHISQIETGAIERPAPNLLWALATAYGIDFKKLMRMAGHTHQNAAANRGSVLNAAFRALDDMTPGQQAEVLDYMEKLRGAKKK